jgi:hypothetical protein
VKIVFVAGFFDPVLKALQDTYPDHLKSGGSIVWIRQVGPGRELNINDFKSRLFDKLSKGARDILIIVAVLRGKEWVEEIIRSIVGGAEETYPDAEIRLQFEKSAQSSSTVLTGIATFGLSPPPEISMDRLAEKLQGKKVLCVGLDGHAGFEGSLERAGFPKDAFAEYFVELTFSGGKHSNLIKLLNEKAKSYDHLLYSWSGLRSMPPAVKKKYSGVGLEASSSFEVVLLFKRWVLGN